TIGGGNIQPPPPPGPDPGPGALVFRETRPPREQLNREDLLDWEVHTEGHYDFWFENKKETPLRVKLDSVGCKCTTAEVVVLPAAGAEVARHAGGARPVRDLQ